MTGNMTNLHLLARIGGERVALPAASIESVIEVEALTPVPRVGCHVAGLAPLRSRVLTIIDAARSIGIDAPVDPNRPAVVVAVDGHCYGLLIDAVEDVASCTAVPRPLGKGHAAGWARVARGTIEHDGHALLLVDPAAIVAGPPAPAA